MEMGLKRAIKIALCLSLPAAGLTGVSFAGEGYRGSIEAGVVGGVAGVIAGQALMGAMPPGGYYGQPYPPPCRPELFQERDGYSRHYGERLECQ
jgi:hypothetical protein